MAHAAKAFGIPCTTFRPYALGELQPCQAHRGPPPSLSLKADKQLAAWAQRRRQLVGAVSGPEVRTRAAQLEAAEARAAGRQPRWPLGMATSHWLAGWRQRHPDVVVSAGVASSVQIKKKKEQAKAQGRTAPRSAPAAGSVGPAPGSSSSRPATIMTALASGFSAFGGGSRDGVEEEGQREAMGDMGGALAGGEEPGPDNGRAGGKRQRTMTAKMATFVTSKPP